MRSDATRGAIEGLKCAGTSITDEPRREPNACNVVVSAISIVSRESSGWWMEGLAWCRKSAGEWQVKGVGDKLVHRPQRGGTMEL